MDTHFDSHPAAAVAVTLHSLDTADEIKERTLVLAPSAIVPIGRASKSAHKGLHATETNAYIDSPVASRNHAQLSVQAPTGIPTVYIKDLDSMHGTYLNAVELEKKKDVKLSSGDVIKFGIDVVRDQHTFFAKEYRFVSKPHTCSGTYGLTYNSDDDDDEVNSDVSDEERSSSGRSESNEPTSEIIGTQSNPVYLGDEDSEAEAGTSSEGDDASVHLRDDDEEIEYGSDAGEYDNLPKEALFDLYSEDGGEDFDSGCEFPHSSSENYPGERLLQDFEDSGDESESDESNGEPDHAEDLARLKMHEMLDHAQNPLEEQQSAENVRPNVDRVTPVDSPNMEAGLKDQVASLPTPPLTTTRPYESLRPSSISMSLSTIMHQEKDDMGATPNPTAKPEEPKTTVRHPWDWSYAYNNPWDPECPMPRPQVDQGTDLYMHGVGRDFTLTSSRFDNPYVPPTRSQFMAPHTTCPPSSHQMSIHDHTTSITPFAPTSSLSAAQAFMTPPERVLASTAPPPTIQTPKEKSMMSITEIVEPAVVKEVETGNSKKRKIDDLEHADAAVESLIMAAREEMSAAREEMLAQVEQVAPALQPQRPIKKMRLRKTATAMAGILVGTVSAVGALAFLPDVFFQ